MPRLMDTYDPNWERRLDMMLALGYEHLNAHRGSLSPEYIQKSKWFRDEVNRAHFARYRTVPDYEDAMRQLAQSSAREGGCLLPWPDLGDDATREDVDATYNAYEKSVDRVRAFKSLPACVEWDEPVFRSKLPDGVTRTMDNVVVGCGDMSGTFPIVIEQHPEHWHVCLILKPGLGMFTFAVLREIQSRIEPPPKRRWWQRRLRPQPPISFYCYWSQVLWRTHEQIRTIEMVWDGERYRGHCFKQTRPVPRILFEAALDTDPALKWLAGAMVNEPSP